MTGTVKHELNVKKDFPILNKKIHGKQLIYLDNAATTQKPKQVISAMKKFYEETNANVHRGIHVLSEEATAAYSAAREKVADFINAAEDEIIFTKGTTDSINMVVSMLEPILTEGDEIVLTEMEHHSNLVPWQRLQKRQAVLRFVPITKDLSLDIDAYKDLLSNKPKIVAFTHVSNVLGTLNKVKEMVHMAHEVGAIVVVDGAQAVAHIPVDVKELDVDFYAFSGHKMYGPTGVGVLYGKKKLLEMFDPPQRGGGMIKQVTLTDATWNDLPEKFEAGTPNIAGAVGLGAAVDYLKNIGMDVIKTHNRYLFHHYQAEIRTAGLKGLTLYSHELSYGIASSTFSDIHPHDVAHVLDKLGIAVRAGHHCCMPLMMKLGITGTTRASFAIYNTREDVDALVAGLKKVQEVFH